jgi:probable rRNA maturation factor
LPICFAASPPDVRQGFASPMNASLCCGYAAGGGVPDSIKRITTERQSLSAHQAAEPSKVMVSKIEVVNRQRLCKINAQQWREFSEKALQAIGGDNRSAAIVFVGDEAIKKLNRQFRGKNYATDVLSFPSQAEAFEVEHRSQLGEVVISVHRAMAQAKEHGLPFSCEVKQLILHGLLHLCGYDHETDRGEMDRLELKLRKQLGI